MRVFGLGSRSFFYYSKSNANYLNEKFLHECARKNDKNGEDVISEYDKCVRGKDENIRGDKFFNNLLKQSLIQK